MMNICFAGKKIIGIENVDKEELENLYQAKANKKIPIINFALYVWIYHLGKHNFDSAKVERKIARINEKYDRKISKHPDNDLKQRKIEVKREKKLLKQQRVLSEGNMLMRWGEPVSVYDEKTIGRTKSQFEQYLRNRGYFDATVEFTTKTRFKNKYVTYMIEEDQAHIIDTFRLVVSDSTIRQLVESSREESFLLMGERMISATWCWSANGSKKS
jgi:outer membrane protein insertion porin family